MRSFIMIIRWFWESIQRCGLVSGRNQLWEPTVWSEKAMAPHSSTLAWKIPWREEPGGPQSMGSLSWTRLSNFTLTFHFHALEKEMATHSSVLAWRIPGTAEPGSLPSMGSHRVRHDWNDLAAAAAAAAVPLCYLRDGNSNQMDYSFYPIAPVEKFSFCLLL